MSKFVGYLGAYTKRESKGVYRFELDTEQKKLTTPELVAELDNPTYLTITNDNKFLYAVHKEGEEGGLQAFQIVDEAGSLQPLNGQFAPGSAPCHVSVNKDSTLVLSANYHTKEARAYKVETDGSLLEGKAVTHEGSGPHERQEKPHLHYAGFTPDEKYAIVVDLGTDTVTSYKIDGDFLRKEQELQTRAGSGPRHLVFHPNGEYAYVMTELSNEVITLKYVGDGSFEELQYISTIPTDFTENSQGSAIHISSDGKFIYAGNRGHNSIALFEVQEDFTLKFIEWTSTEGDWPRDFVLDPTESFIVATNQESDNMVLFERNKQTGKLTLLQKDIYAPEAVCVKFLHYHA